MLKPKNLLTAIILCSLLMLSTATTSIAEVEKTAVETAKAFFESINQGDLDGVQLLLAPDMAYVYEEEDQVIYTIDEPEHTTLLFEEMILLDARFMVEEIEVIGDGVVQVEGKLTDAVYQMRLPEYEEGLEFRAELRITEATLDKMVIEVDPKAVRLYYKRDLGSIGIWVVWENDTIVFEDVLEDHPADLAGVEIGDRLIAVDGQLVADMRQVLVKVVTYIRGEPGSTVHLTIERNGEIMELEMEREMIH